MSPLAKLLREHRKAGVYRAVQPPAPLAAAAAEAGFAHYSLDAASARTKSAMLGLTSRVLSFPSWFGRNWDALEDCLTDLSWIDAPGIVVEFEGYETYAKADPDGFIILLDIFKTSSEYWRGEGKAIWVILTGKAAARLELPILIV